MNKTRKEEILNQKMQWETENFFFVKQLVLLGKKEFKEIFGKEEYNRIKKLIDNEIPNEKYKEVTFEEVSIKIDNEGLGYYVESYTDGSSLPNYKAIYLFIQAQKALSDFTDYIEKKLNEEKEIK